jgi:proteasome beta subunit
VTVILGLRCAEGLVIASDSQATNQVGGGTPVRLDAAKVKPLGKHILWAGTGAQGCSQRIEAALLPHAAKYGPSQDQWKTARAIQGEANKVQLASAQSFVQFSPTAHREAWGGIFCGWSKEGPWIMEIDLNGGWQFHDPFAATGSGMAFAHLAIGSIQHYDPQTQSLDAAKAIAYRAIETTCTVSAYGVGMPVQLGVVLKDGAKLLSEAEREETKELVNLWKAKEVDTLGEVAPKTAAEPIADAEDSEALDAPEEE